VKSDEGVGLFGLQSAHGKYLCLEDDGNVSCGRDTVEKWESLQFIDLSECPEDMSTPDKVMGCPMPCLKSLYSEKYNKYLAVNAEKKAVVWTAKEQVHESNDVWAIVIRGD
jgi:hypothetical protein